MRSVYGENLARKFGAEEVGTIVTRSLQGAEVAVTEIRVDQPIGRLSNPIPREDGYMICFGLVDLPKICYLEERRQVSVLSLHAGDISLHDLRREPAALIDKPLHSLLLYLPSRALNALAAEGNVPYRGELHYEPGVGVFDEMIKQIGLSFLPALRHPDCISRLCTDHLAFALTSHVAQTYGGIKVAARAVQGGLAGWQEKRAKEMLASDLSGSTALQEIAEACGLSVGYFSRAFRKTTGLAPHAWLLRARVDSAKELLRGRNASLSAIALACGFADQSHFTRVFTRQVGLSPGAWRRTAAN